MVQRFAVLGAVCLLSGLAACGASVDTNSPEYLNGLACRAYARAVGKVGQTVADWTGGLATDADAVVAFAALAQAAEDNSTYTVGASRAAFVGASTGWKSARVALVTGGDLTGSLQLAVDGDKGVRDVCQSIGEPIP